MKRIGIILLVCIVAMACLSGVTFAAAESQHDVKIELAKTEKNGILTVTAKMTENDGIAALALRVEYDGDCLILRNRSFGYLASEMETMDVYGTEEDAIDPEKTASPYTISFLSVKNVSNTGVLFTLEFSIKDDAPKGDFDVDLYVCELAYRTSTNVAVYNEKYDSHSPYREGGVKAASTSYTLDSNGLVKEENKNASKLVIALAVSGAALVVVALVVAFLVYRKKKK